MTSLSTKIRDALAEVDALGVVLATTQKDLVRAHTAAQRAITNTLTDLARIKRELREIDADLTPVDERMRRT